jgi:hypothetical protein
LAGCGQHLGSISSADILRRERGVSGDEICMVTSGTAVHRVMQDFHNCAGLAHLRSTPTKRIFCTRWQTTSSSPGKRAILECFQLPRLRGRWAPPWRRTGAKPSSKFQRPLEAPEESAAISADFDCNLPPFHTCPDENCTCTSHNSVPEVRSRQPRSN